MLRPDELGIDLVCPDCRRPLARIEQIYLCSDGVCRRAYNVIDDLPSLVVEDSHVLELAEWQEHMAAHSSAPARPSESSHAH